MAVAGNKSWKHTTSALVDSAVLEHIESTRITLESVKSYSRHRAHHHQRRIAAHYIGNRHTLLHRDHRRRGRRRRRRTGEGRGDNDGGHAAFAGAPAWLAAGRGLRVRAGGRR